MNPRVTILGAGFAGLELSTRLSQEFGGNIDVTLIDKSDSFVFGYAKLEVAFGREPMESARLPYAKFTKPGVRFLQEAVTGIDPATRRVMTASGPIDADYLVVALGADYDHAATPGLLEGGHDFYSLAGVARMREALPAFTGGKVVIGVASFPYKCPPAPSECTLMIHDYLVSRGIRDRCEITLAIPMPVPVPPSPETSKALLAEFESRGIRFIGGNGFKSVNAAAHTVTLSDGTELPCDLFLGVPKHRAPQVLVDSGMVDGAWVKVDARSLETRWPGVYAAGDVADTGGPKAGVFAESAARAIADSITAAIRGKAEKGVNAGQGECYIEFGGGRVARVRVDFLSGPKPVGVYESPTLERRADKALFGSSRRSRWFGL
jgi:sulfide:quinone oxidoreductase